MLRFVVVAVIAMTGALSGCLGSDEAPGPDDNGSDPPPGHATLPDNLSAEERVVGATPLAAVLSSGGCSGVLSATCYPYEVRLDDAAVMTATLRWSVEANDFDLLLVQDGEVVEQSRALPPGTEETLIGSLDAATYELLVVAYLVTADTFQLDAVFTST